MVKKRFWWVPVRVTTVGYARVEAYSGEDALQMVDNGDFNPEELVNGEVDDVETTGAPMVSEID